MIGERKFKSRFKKFSSYFLDPALLLLSLYYLIQFLGYQIGFINYPFQHFPKEGATPSQLYLLDQGLSIFSYTVVPAYHYVYGWVYPMIGHLFIHNEYLINLRILTTVFAGLSALLCSLFIFKYSPSKIWAFILFPLFFALAIQQSNGAVPSTIGQFFYIGCILVPLSFRSNWALIVSGLFGLLGFYTKSYFLIGPSLVALVLFLFRSKKIGIIYGILFILSLILSIPIVTHIFPSYFEGNFFHHLGSPFVSKSSHMLQQLDDFFGANKYLILSLVFLILSGITGSIISRQKSIQWNKPFKVNILNIDQPVFQDIGLIVYFICMLFFTVLAFVLVMGTHPGATNGSYLYHLAIPFIIIILPLTFSQGNFINKFIVQVFFGLQLILLSIPYAPGRDFELLEKRMAPYVELISSKSQVLNSPSLTAYFIDQELPIYVNGHSIFFREGIVPQNPNAELVKRRNTDYVNSIKEKVRNREFDLLIKKKNESIFGFGRKFLFDSGYKILREDRLPLIGTYFFTEFWVLESEYEEVDP